jgi:hypothetical protein
MKKKVKTRKIERGEENEKERNVREGKRTRKKQM